MKKYVKIQIFVEFNQSMKSDEIPCIIYVDIESLIKKEDVFANTPEISSATKVGEHIPYGYPMSTNLAFDHIENIHNLCRGKDCIEKLCASLRKNATDQINFEKRKCYH